MKKAKYSPELRTAARNARRLFLMVAKLHKLGYEGIRVCPFLSPSGCYWRCAIVPAFMTDPAHGARLAESVDFESVPHYTSGFGDNYFGWGADRNSPRPKTPLQMARWFTWEFSALAEQGHHPDPAYAEWLSRMLEQTAPIGVVHAFEDGVSPVDQMLTDFCEEGVVVRVPPEWKPTPAPKSLPELR